MTVDKIGEIRTYQARWSVGNRIWPIVSHYELLEHNMPKPTEPIETPPRPVMDTQVGGDHYKKMAIQPAHFCQANNIPFIEGSVIKYMSRHRDKDKEKDILKAIHFCQMILKLTYGIESSFTVES